MTFIERLLKSVKSAAVKGKQMLQTEKKVVQRKGSAPFMETFHVKPDKGKAQEPKLHPIGTEIKFLPEGAKNSRTGIILKVNKDHYSVQGRRNEQGQVPIYKVAHADATPYDKWAKIRYAMKQRKTPEDKYGKGDNNKANFTLSAEELRRRKHVMEKRIGFNEARIITHPSFTGPAFKRVAELAQQNGIPTPLRSNDSALLWNRAENVHHQEMLFAYAMGAMKGWRRLLSADASMQVKNNVDEFKQVIEGKKKWSYVHEIMHKEGEAAAIKYLKEYREARDNHEPMDISDLHEDPHGRKLLESNSSQPMQLKYTLAVNKETLQDDLKKIVAGMEPSSREIMRLKFGIGKDAVGTNEEVAEHLNEKGLAAPDGKPWSRVSVGQAISKIVAGFKQVQPTIDRLESKYTNNGLMRPLTEWDSSDRQLYTMAQHVAGLGHHMDEKLGRKIYNSESLAGAIHMQHLPEPHGAVKILSKKEVKSYQKTLGKSLPEADHPAGDFEVGDFTYTVAHRDGQALLLKAAKGEQVIEDATFDLLVKAAELEEMRKSFPETVVHETSKGICFLLPEGERGDELRKSFSSDMADKYPGGRWITITDTSSPMHGRHLYILPHRDGSATILVGGGPTLRHKVLTLKRQDEGKKGNEDSEKTTGKKDESKQEEKKEKPVLTEDQRKDVDDSIKVLSGKIHDQKSQLVDFVRQQWGIDRELTADEKSRIEKKVSHIEDPVIRSVEAMKATAAIQASKENDVVKQIINAAKQALIQEEPVAGEGKGIASVVKDNAESLIGKHLAIKFLEGERKDLRKMIRVGKLHDRFRSGEEILADFTPLSSSEIREAVADEHALHNELAAHYKLMKKTRGIEGVDGNGEDGDLRQGKELERNIKQGGFETLTGVIGQHTKKAIMSKKVYDALGSNNAAILARHYLTTAGHDPKAVAADIGDFIASENSPVAYKANERGKYFMEQSQKVRAFGKGSNNIMTMAQATGTSLRYLNKAYEAYGQAEGALNQGAELMYSLKGTGNQSLEFSSAFTDSLDRKRIALGLGKSDVTVKKEQDGSYKMTVPPRSFEKMLREDDTFAHGRGLGLEYTPEELADGKANTDEFFPSGLNTYTPVDAEGRSEKVVVRPHEQAACRFLAQQKKIYLNFDAGTGKSKTALMMKAHLDDLHGKQHKMIVAMPDKVTSNFADEVRKWTGYEPVIVTGKMSPQRRKKLFAAANGNQVFIVNHEMMNFDRASIRDAGFDIVVADEAHKISQREGSEKSLKSDGLHEIASEAPYYVAMSGTPVPSNLSQLYFHLNAADPERFSSQKEFMAQFGSVHKGVGYKKAVAQFMSDQLSDRVMTLKKNIDAEFVHQTHRVEMTEPQRKAYKHVMEFFGTSGKTQGAILNRDRQLTYLLNGADTDADYKFENNGKYDKLKHIIDDHLKGKASTEKVGIYAQNNATVREIQRFLAKHYPEYDHVVFNGDTKKSELDGLKARVTGDPKTKFSLHMKAGVEGLNIQHMINQQGLTTVVAMASGEDSFSTLDQFFARGWRTGANKTIHGHTILTDSPHDIATEMRLDEKKKVGELVRTDKRSLKKSISNAFLFVKRQNRSAMA